jgi:hypothetical protein
LNENARHEGKQRQRLPPLLLLLLAMLVALLAPRPQIKGGLGNIRGREKLDLNRRILMKKLHALSLGASNSLSHQAEKA